jgi:hypothetical protein
MNKLDHLAYNVFEYEYYINQQFSQSNIIGFYYSRTNNRKTMLLNELINADMCKKLFKFRAFDLKLMNTFCDPE